MPSQEVLHTIITFGVLAATVTCFAIGRFRADVVALCALLVLMVSGVLSPVEALSGFSSTVVLTLAGVFVVSAAIVRSGLAAALSDQVLKVAGTNRNTLFMLIMLATAAIGSVVNNTGTVAIMMPLVVSMAMSIKESPSRFLMPLAFMSSIGGMLTLIGNPGNMVVNDIYVKAGFESLSFFSFLPVGLVSLAFGLLVVVPATSVFLARRKAEQSDTGRERGPSLKDLADKYRLGQNMYKIYVPAVSGMVGQSLLDLGLTGKYGVVIQEIRRSRAGQAHFGQARREQIAPDRATRIEARDLLYCIGTYEHIKEMAAEHHLQLMASFESDPAKDKYNFESIGICELVLMSASRVVNRALSEAGLRQQFGITVLGIQRGDQYILDDLKDQILQSGDALLVQGRWEDLARLDDYSSNWVVVGRPREQARKARQSRHMPVVGVVLFLMVALLAAGALPAVTAVLLAAVALGLCGVFRNMEEIYSSISWETIVLVACMLPMAVAMEKTGMVGKASDLITEIGRAQGPLVALAVVYAVSSGLNILIAGTPVALLVAPVGIQVALGLGVSPLPFVYGVAAAACMCFASPFSTPSNALVMSAGRYTFFDYLKIGLPLQALMGVVMVLVLPLLFPF